MQVLYVGPYDKAFAFFRNYKLSEEELKDSWDLFLVKDYNCPSSQDRGKGWVGTTTGFEKKKDDSILSYVIKSKLSDAEQTPVACLIEPEKYPNRESIEQTNYWRHALVNVASIKYL